MSQIALDWDFENQCFASLELDFPESLVEWYIADVCEQCVGHLEKRPLDEGAKARFGLMVAGSLLCRRDFGRRMSWSSCLLYTSPSPRDQRGSRMPSSA